MNVPFDRKRGLIVVNARIHGPSGDAVRELALDTGASVTMVSRETLELCGYELAAVREIKRVTTGSGVETIPDVKVTRIECLGLAKELGLLCHTLPASASVDGVLGLDFLAGHRLLIDFQDDFLRIE